MIRNLLRNFFNTPLKIHISLLIGLHLSISYFYFLFIFKRPLREIPFTLTFWSFCSIVVIICFQIYFFYRYFKPLSHPSTLLRTFVQHYLFWILDSLAILDAAIKALPFIEKRYDAFVLNVIRNFNINKSHLGQKLLMLKLLPRILLVSIFFIDVFYFHKLHYIYNFIWLGALIFTDYYIIFCLKILNANHIAFLEKNVQYIFTIYRFGVLPAQEDYWSDSYIEDEDEPSEEPPTRMRLDVRKFLDYRWWCIKNNDEHKEDYYHCEITSAYYYEYIKKFNLSHNQRLQMEQRDELFNSVKEKVSELMKSHQIMYFIRSTFVERSNNNIMLNISLLISWFYFLSWLYIVVVSLPSISLITISIASIKASRILEEPFSGVILSEIFSNFQ